MSKCYGLLADIHAHNWQAFSTVNENGINSRLEDICDEIKRCVVKTIQAGGDTVVIAGDLFHIRGNVNPTVFNVIKNVLETSSVAWKIIPGNHDLETDETTVLGNSVSMLSGIRNVEVFNEVTLWRNHTLLVPWIKNPKKFLEKLKENYGYAHDIICHIGVDNTMVRMPNSGVVTVKSLKENSGACRFFCGHYHQYKNHDGDVYSIGAPTQHTWSDVGSKAGFMIIHEDKEEWFESLAPKFIELDGKEANFNEIIPNNFIKANVYTSDPKLIKSWRTDLIERGAKGVIINPINDKVSADRVGVTKKSLSSLATSITDYVLEKKLSNEINKKCMNILDEVT